MERKGIVWGNWGVVERKQPGGLKPKSARSLTWERRRRGVTSYFRQLNKSCPGPAQ
jgi:hypothetical protein